MLAARLKNILFSLLAVEIVSSTLSFVMCCYVVYQYPLTFDLNIAKPLFYLIALYLIALFSFLVIFYQKIVRFSSFTHSISWGGFFTAQATLLTLGLVFLVLAVLFAKRETAYIILGFTLSSMILIAGTYAVASSFLRSLYNQPANKLRILVVGMNRRTHMFCRVLSSTPHLGAEVRGYLDDRVFDDAPAKYSGRPEDIGDVLRKDVIDVVFIFLPVRSYYDTIHKVIETSGFYGVTAYIVGNVFETDNIKKQPLCINDFGSMAFSSTSVDYVGLAVKRVMDVVMSFCGLALLSPLFVLVALYVKLVSRGPVFFSQERIGLNKRTFNMIKFRTMVPDAEARLDELTHLNEMDGPAFKIANDPRLIKGGSFLRRHSLDELPQLWNVLRGDMSVVGPRPLSRRDFDLLQEDWQRKRFSMRPGLTCIWQVSGRNDVTFIEWMRMDLDYIDRWSLSLDFVLIFKTIRTVFIGSGR